MRIRSEGSTTVIHTGYELVVLGAERYRVQVRGLDLWSPTVGAPLEVMWQFERELLALSPSGSRLTVQSTHRGNGPELMMIEIEARIARKLTADNVEFVDDDSQLSVRSQAGGTCGLFLGKPGTLPIAVPLPPPITIAWPSTKSAVWKKRPKDRDAPLSQKARMTATRFGIAIIDAAAGLVMRAARSNTPSIAAYRVPTEGEHSEVDILAYATPTGAVIAHSGGRSTGAINHFAHDGRHLGGLAVRGNASDVAVVDDRAYFLRERDDDSGDMELVTATLPTLEVVDVTGLEISAYHAYAGLALASDGSVWAGNGGAVLRRTPDGATQQVDLASLPLVTFDDRAWR
jgi:hypothetical protein